MANRQLVVAWKVGLGVRNVPLMAAWHQVLDPELLRRWHPGRVGILDALSWDGDMGFYDEEIKGESHRSRITQHR